jgi:hypothetical protein
VEKEAAVGNEAVGKEEAAEVLATEVSGEVVRVEAGEEAVKEAAGTGPEAGMAAAEKSEAAGSQKTPALQPR